MGAMGDDTGKHSHYLRNGSICNVGTPTFLARLPQVTRWGTTQDTRSKFLAWRRLCLHAVSLSAFEASARDAEVSASSVRRESGGGQNHGGAATGLKKSPGGAFHRPIGSANLKDREKSSEEKRKDRCRQHACRLVRDSSIVGREGGAWPSGGLESLNADAAEGSCLWESFLSVVRSIYFTDPSLGGPGAGDVLVGNVVEPVVVSTSCVQRVVVTAGSTRIRPATVLNTK